MLHRQHDDDEEAPAPRGQVRRPERDAVGFDKEWVVARQSPVILGFVSAHALLKFVMVLTHTFGNDDGKSRWVSALQASLHRRSRLQAPGGHENCHARPSVRAPLSFYSTARSALLPVTNMSAASSGHTEDERRRLESNHHQRLASCTRRRRMPPSVFRGLHVLCAPYTETLDVETDVAICASSRSSGCSRPRLALLTDPPVPPIPPRPLRAQSGRPRLPGPRRAAATVVRARAHARVRRRKKTPTKPKRRWRTVPLRGIETPVFRVVPGVLTAGLQRVSLEGVRFKPSS